MIVQLQPRAFFRMVLAPALARNKSLSPASVMFRVLGKQHREDWSVDLGRGLVRRGPTAKPGLYVEMAEPDFTAMMAGTLEIGTCIEEGRFRYRGDIGLLQTLATVLTAPVSPMNPEMRSAA